LKFLQVVWVSNPLMHFPLVFNIFFLPPFCDSKTSLSIVFHSWNTFEPLWLQIGEWAFEQCWTLSCYQDCAPAVWGTKPNGISVWEGVQSRRHNSWCDRKLEVSSQEFSQSRQESVSYLNSQILWSLTSIISKLASKLNNPMLWNQAAFIIIGQTTELYPFNGKILHQDIGTAGNPHEGEAFIGFLTQHAALYFLHWTATWKTNSCGNELLFVYWNEFCGASMFLVAHGWGRCLEDCKEWPKHISKVFLVVSFFHSYKTHGTILLPALIFNKWINLIFAMYIWKMVMCKQSSNPTCIIQQYLE
jgi:hypothetical protein